MIAKLRGIVDSIGEESLVVDVNGVGYLVFCSARLLGRLSTGASATLTIETHVREDHIHLYGFADDAERDWFRRLNSVQGVGAKAALAILGVLDAASLLDAVVSRDIAAFRRAPGVGPKLAGRIVNELKDKIGGFAMSEGGPVTIRVGEAAGGAATADAVSALVNLGYGASEALRAVTAAARSVGDGARVEQLIRAGLTELVPKDAAS